MHDKKELLQAKSYTGISDIFGSTPFNNVLYRNPKKNNNDPSVTGETIGESDRKSILKNSALLNQAVYVTCEKYHGLNKNFSCKSIVHSTSTIFCDLDDIAKRHSFHCLTEVSVSNANILKVMKLPVSKNGFKGKSNAIVQECATQIHPKVLAKDSMEINTKKAKKNYPQNDVLSSEIFLRDGKYRKHGKKQYYNIDYTSNHQKFWSYAKYRTEYTKPIPEEKKIKEKKKKEQGKRTEDPCPCQLFSYACPCTDEKSLCELAKNSKCLTVADQITSTTKMTYERKKKQANECVRENKLTNTIVSKHSEIINPQNEPIIEIANKQDIPVLADLTSKCSPRDRKRSSKKIHKVICPKCKEKVEVVSTTEEEECLKLENSSIYRSKELTSTYNCSTSLKDKNKSFDDGDVCNHEPRCELVPICQILPIENEVESTKSNRNRPSTKSTPRIIRITKACRHHPPCTVVPSCQRANVLRNNCEYIPPCLHRPRCVNLPLCVPFSKSIHYDEPSKHMDEEENPECIHASGCKYIPVCELERLGTNNADRNYNTVTHVQNAREYRNGNRVSAYIINPKSTLMAAMSPPQISTSPCCSCRSNKSCQYECSECKCVYSSHLSKGSASVDAIVFIRDVGCQFKNKTYSPKDSMVRSKTSSASFDLVDVKTGNYYTAVHTLRCEDKFTTPKSGMESISTDSIISREGADSHCPSHGRRSSRNQWTGFNPSQRYTTAFFKAGKAASCTPERQKDLSKSEMARNRDSTFPVRSRRSFLKRKYRKMLAAKRRRKSKTSSLIVTSFDKNC